jgi:hypothetical protein
VLQPATGYISPFSDPGRAHPIINAHFFNVGTTSSQFTLSDAQVTYYQTTQTTDDSGAYYYILHNSPNGFTSTSPLIDYHGSSTYENPFENDYVITSSVPSSWSDANGYIFYEYDAGTG